MRVTDRLREIARGTAETLGYPSIADQIDVWDDGDVVRVKMNCRDLLDQSISVDKGGDVLEWLRDGTEQHAHFQARFSELVRLEVRRVHVGNDDPAWSVALPSLMAQLFDRMDLGFDELIARGRKSWESFDLDDRPDVEISVAGTQSGRLNSTMSFEERNGVLLSVIAGRGEDGECTVVVTGLDMPETIASSIRDVPLSSLVAHEDLDACPSQIVSHVTRRRRNGERILDLHLVPDIAWRGHLPPDADVSWRNLRLGAIQRAN